VLVDVHSRGHRHPRVLNRKYPHGSPQRSAMAADLGAAAIQSIARRCRVVGRALVVKARLPWVVSRVHLTSRLAPVVIAAGGLRQ
jgi:hypothetical protein